MSTSFIRRLALNIGIIFLRYLHIICTHYAINKKLWSLELYDGDDDDDRRSIRLYKISVSRSTCYSPWMLFYIILLYYLYRVPRARPARFVNTGKETSTSVISYPIVYWPALLEANNKRVLYIVFIYWRWLFFFFLLFRQRPLNENRTNIYSLYRPCTFQQKTIWYWLVGRCSSKIYYA